MNAKAKKNVVPDRAVAMDCAVKVVVAVLIIAAFVGVLGWLIENWSDVKARCAAVWAGLMFMASLDGHSFWYATSGASFAMATAAWALCVEVKTDPGGEEKISRRTVALMLYSLAAWLIFFFAASGTFADFSSLSAYRSVAYVIICAPWVVVVCSIFGFLVSFLQPTV